MRLLAITMTRKWFVNVLEIKLTTGEPGAPVHKAASLFTRDDTKPYVQGKLRLSDDAFNAIESEFRYRGLMQGLSGSVPGTLATKWARMNFEMLRSSLPSGDRSVINITKGSLPEACVQAFVLLCRHHGYAYNTVDFNFYPTHDQDVLFGMQWKDKFGADMRKDEFNRLAEGKTADEKSLELDAENARQETKGFSPKNSGG